MISSATGGMFFVFKLGFMLVRHKLVFMLVRHKCKKNTDKNDFSGHNVSSLTVMYCHRRHVKRKGSM